MRLTLNGVLTAGLVGLAVLLGVVYSEVDRSSGELTEKSAAQLRSVAIERAGADIERFLLQGEQVVTDLVAQLKAGDCENAQACLMAALLANPSLTEVTLTTGTIDGPENERTGQLSVYREPETAGKVTPICTRTIRHEGDRYLGWVRCRPEQAGADHTESIAVDPTKDPAFVQPAYRRTEYLFKSDLSFSTLDNQLPEAQRRVVLVRMMGFEDQARNQVRVVKVGLRSELIDRHLQEIDVTPRGPDGVKDPHRIFIADEQGRLITRPDPRKDQMKELGDDLRVSAALVAPEIQAALTHPALARVRPDNEETEPSELVKSAEDTFDLAGRAYHVSYRLLDRTYGWRVGIVGPDDFFLGPLKKQRMVMIFELGGVFVALFLGGFLAVRVLRRALFQIEHETAAMSSLHFAPTQATSPFADVRETLHSLEQAKTAVRAMGRYVPMTLVRRLFQENKEPALGGTMREVTIFFSDIEGFTTRAEEEPPDVVAQWLGQYLEVMTNAVHSEDGTVDKFIGDAVMALWNAPQAHEDHAVKACRAALRCQQETARLYASPDWKGRPPLVTRIGLHVGAVMVGHFGAPDRLSYTAIGDCVNLASRLEGLNKAYGTTVLCSDEVFKRTRHVFAYRRLDRVAVKGKSQAIVVYELLGELATPGLVTAEHQRYEQALELYVAGQFAPARALLLQNPKDPPSIVLAQKCAEFEREPPAQPWAGISFAQSK